MPLFAFLCPFGFPFLDFGHIIYREGHDEPLYATDEDFRTALLLTDKLILHTADSFTQIHGDRTAPLPASRTSVQRLTFLAQLPEKFTTAECEKKALEVGVTARTARRWIESLLLSGELLHISHGEYQKVA